MTETDKLAPDECAALHALQDMLLADVIAREYESAQRSERPRIRVTFQRPIIHAATETRSTG